MLGSLRIYRKNADEMHNHKKSFFLFLARYCHIQYDGNLISDISEALGYHTNLMNDALSLEIIK